MASSVRRLSLVLAAAVALCLAAPLAASAANTRYASPTGGTAPCLETSPCSLANALSFAEGLGSFDKVLLAPGTYHPTGELKVEGAFVTVEGEPGKPVPLIEAASGERGLLFTNTGTLRDVRIHSTTSTIYGLVMIGAESVVERVQVTGGSYFACAMGAVVMRDTLCVAEPSLGAGEGVTVFTAGTLPETFETTLFNVTAIGLRTGIFAGANDHSTVIVNAANTIASGGVADVIAESDTTTAPVAVNLAHSNFDLFETEGSEAHVTAPTANANQTAPPLFVDAAGGDFREQATSPTRLAGDLSVLLPGEVDLAGNPRSTDCGGTVGVDIGAYQYECPPPETPPVVVPPKEERKPDPPVCACVGTGSALPHLKHLAMKPDKFVAVGKAPKEVAHGTTISFYLNATASVTLEVLGKKTVKGKKKTVTIGKLAQVTGKAGANTVKFSGKVKGKPLEPGKYTLRATATTGGLASTPATKTFEVLAPTS